MTVKIQFSNDQKTDIKNQYLISKKNISQIASRYNVSVTPIKSVLKELSIKIRKPQETSRKYTIDENYFENINSKNKAYCLGFLMADGYNDEVRNVIQLAVCKKDIEVLNFFNKELKCNKPIRNIVSNNYESVRQDFCSKKLSLDIKKYGCIQNKTETLNFPDNISDGLLSDFIRGYFDGDGCFYYCVVNRNNGSSTIMSKVAITSSVVFLDSLKKILKNKLNITSSMSFRHFENKKIGTLTITGNLQVMKFMSWIYNDPETYCLGRKKEKYKKFLFEREMRFKKYS